MENSEKEQIISDLKNLERNPMRELDEQYQKVAQHLSSDDDDIRAEAVNCLRDFVKKAILFDLIDFVENDPSLKVRKAAIRSLGRYLEIDPATCGQDPESEDAMSEGNNEGLTPLVSRDEQEKAKNFLSKLFRDDGSSVELRKEALKALVGSLTTSIDPQKEIKKAYNSDDVELTKAALEAMRLGRLSNQWEDEVIQATNHPNREVRDLAFDAMKGVRRSNEMVWDLYLDSELKMGNPFECRICGNEKSEIGFYPDANRIGPAKYEFIEQNFSCDPRDFIVCETCAVTEVGIPPISKQEIWEDISQDFQSETASAPEQTGSHERCLSDFVDSYEAKVRKAQHWLWKNIPEDFLEQLSERYQDKSEI